MPNALDDGILLDAVGHRPPASYSPPGFNVVAQTRYGPMLCNRLDAYVGASLQTYGEFSEGEAALFRRLLTPGAFVIEVGANIGALTIPIAQHVGRAGMVMAIEPQRLAFQCLAGNAALNGLTNIFARQLAIGASRGTLLVPMLDPEVPHNIGGLELGKFEHGEPVPLIPLDDAVLELPRLDLLKADVEGAELAVVLGARRLLMQHRPALYVEADREPKVPALLGALEQLGYTRLYWHAPPLFNAENYNGMAENIFTRSNAQGEGANIVSVNLLAFHASQEVPQWIHEVPDLEPVR